MAFTIGYNVPSAKGALCYCLDEFSKGPGATARVKKLRDAIAGIAPKYAGLAEVFDEHLVSHVFTGAAARKKILDGLNAHWFDPSSSSSFFPGAPVSQIYAKGVIKTLDLSLKGKGPAVPIDAWWMLDATEVSMQSFAAVTGGVTVGRLVTLIVHTPRPTISSQTAPRPPWILGDTAEAYITRRERDGTVATTRVKTMKVAS